LHVELPAWPGLNPWAAAAWLLELILYSSLASAALRRKLEHANRRLLTFACIVSALLPYLLYAPACGVFQPGPAALLALLATGVSAWYLILPRCPAADAGFLLLVAGVTLARVWKRVYLTPWDWPPMDPLGQLMWIRLGILAALLLRKAEGIGFGWFPSPREWRIGVIHFLAFLPAGLGLALATGFIPDLVPPFPSARLLLSAAATFFGMLWVVALAEEFFFRGLLQRWLGEWLDNPTAGWLLASALFGLAHLPFRSFPNWRFALLAGVAGLFYGRAYRVGEGIRAAMVAHALTNTVWRVLLA
jgi:membrane protease YdiL (CAAX protease family)